MADLNPVHRRLAEREQIGTDDHELTVMCGFYLPESIRDRVKQEATKEGLGFSAWVRQKIVAALSS